MKLYGEKNVLMWNWDKVRDNRTPQLIIFNDLHLCSQSLLAFPIVSLLFVPQHYTVIKINLIY